MSLPLVEKIANAILYDGAVLYPHRSSAVENRRRLNSGVIYPTACQNMQDSGAPCEVETQCLAFTRTHAALGVKVRFLRIVDRIAGYLSEPAAELPEDGEPAFLHAAAIEVDGQSYGSWQEVAECEINLPDFIFTEPAAASSVHRIAVAAARSIKPVRDASGMIAGLIVRAQRELECRIAITSQPVQQDLFRVGVQISNHTALRASEVDRDEALAASLLSTHTILRIRHGEFVSLLEPPTRFQEAAAACRNAHIWPVLAGAAGQRDTILSAPVVLYDYPRVAEDNPGDRFDAAEIDEILSLRILTLSHEEKSAMRRSDERPRRILKRTEMFPSESFMRSQDAFRDLHPAGKRTS